MTSVFNLPNQPGTVSSSAPRDDEVSRLRIPPHSIEAEQSVIGGLLLDNSAWDRAGDLLTDSDFYRFEHRLIYAAIGGLINLSRPADVITVFEQLQSLGKAEECGGLGYLNALAQSVPSAANLRRYAEIVRERAVLRKLVAASDEIATAAFNPQGRPVPQILDEAESKIFKIGEEGSRSRQGFISMDTLVVQLIDRVNELHENGAEEVTGVRTGFYDMDRMTAGLQPGDLIVLAARPSMGKAQPLDSQVRTLSGWKAMGRLEVGDSVASVDGRASIVTGVYPQGERQVFEVRFSDGRAAECCAEHLWLVHCRDWHQPRVLNTEQVRARVASSGAENPLWISPSSGEFGHAEPLPVDPWLLGWLLGHGQLSDVPADASQSSSLNPTRLKPGEPMPVVSESVWHAIADDDIDTAQAINVLRRPAVEPGVRVEAAKAMSGGATRTRYIGRDDESRHTALQLAALPAERKFIPRIYLEADKERRLALLRGLLDAAGTVTLEGRISLQAASRRLADNVAELVRSLSGWCEVATKAKTQSTSYVCRIAHPHPKSLFLLSEKQADVPEQWLQPVRIAITHVEPTRVTPCQCISVSHPSRLYITDGDVVTHNTAFALNMAEHVAVSEGLPVVVFSMEMGAAQLALRMVGSLGRIDQSNLRTGKLRDDEWGRLSEAVEKLGKASIFIDEGSALTPSELRARARRQARQCGQLGLIVVDYLQLMSGSGGGSEENRATVLGEISRGLKSLAKELKCPVIALSQLNRSVETRTDKRPMMSDLRESGAIEQDADVIMFIYRDDYYMKEQSKEPGVAEIIIGKQRNGPTGTIKLAFLKPLTKFENMAPGSSGADMY